MKLNLNADLGESFGPWPMGDDTRLLNVVDSANIACGFHAGDPLVMSTTLKAAIALSVSLGAHPAFPDLQGFGRRTMSIPDDELFALVQYQIAALDGMARARGVALTHVKPHGALNNLACEDATTASVIAEAILDLNGDLILLAPVLSCLADAGKTCGLTIALEIFADRAYTETGTLVSRRLPGAVLETAEECIDHVNRMIEANGVVTINGTTLPTPFHSVCVHGDNAHAVDTATLLREALLAQGHELLALPALLSSVP